MCLGKQKNCSVQTGENNGLFSKTVKKSLFTKLAEKWGYIGTKSACSFA